MSVVVVAECDGPGCDVSARLTTLEPIAKTRVMPWAAMPGSWLVSKRPDLDEWWDGEVWRVFHAAKCYDAYSAELVRRKEDVPY